jgi:hypothetical protein
MDYFFLIERPTRRVLVAIRGADPLETINWLRSVMFE